MTWVVWRSGSILWGAFIHGLFDWLQAATGPWTGLVVFALFSAAALGAEILRLAARRPSPVRAGSTAAHA